MDRRRFVPSADGLEGRQLLSTTKVTTVAATTFQAKVERIAHLPRLLNSVGNGRTLPAGIVTAIQGDMFQIKGKLNSLTDPSRTYFEQTMQDVVPNASLSAANSLKLDNAFRIALESAGTPAGEVTRFRDEMKALARSDANQKTPVILATNDYAIVLQTILAVGRPIRTPGGPKLQSFDDTGVKGDRKTTVAQPRLTGTYDAGATLQIVDAAGHVLGTGTVPSSTNYSVQFARPLAPGTYTVGVRAIDGDITSPVSPALTFTVYPKPGAR